MLYFFIFLLSIINLLETYGKGTSILAFACFGHIEFVKWLKENGFASLAARDAWRFIFIDCISKWTIRIDKMVVAKWMLN